MAYSRSIFSLCSASFFAWILLLSISNSISAAPTPIKGKTEINRHPDQALLKYEHQLLHPTNGTVPSHEKLKELEEAFVEKEKGDAKKKVIHVAREANIGATAPELGPERKAARPKHGDRIGQAVPIHRGHVLDNGTATNVNSKPKHHKGEPVPTHAPKVHDILAPKDTTGVKPILAKPVPQVVHVD